MQTLHPTSNPQDKWAQPFDAWMKSMQESVLRSFSSGPVFTTDINTVELWESYLNTFNDPVDRQYHNCNCCRRFIENYGGLVTIDETGYVQPLLWQALVHADYMHSALTLAIKLKGVKVTGVFYHDNQVLGTPTTGPWKHMWVQQSERPRNVLTAYQRSAEKLESCKNMKIALSCWTEDQLQQAVTLLESEALYRSEKVLGQAQFLLKMKTIKNKNLFWREIALASEGLMHPRASMIGTLLEDLEAGYSIGDASKRFAAKMHPLAYQRPTAAPKSATIEQAEKLMQQMGVERSLERRYATLEDCTPFWLPKPAVAHSGGVFSHLKTRADSPEDASGPVITMTWVKFKETVLPKLTSMQMRTTGTNSYAAFVTAVHADAPNILQWDNPVSWYFHHGGSIASRFNLHDLWTEVVALLDQPSMPTPHQGKGVMFALKGARDSTSTSLCLFPEILRAEFHGIRSVIEAHSNSKRLPYCQNPVAGIMAQSHKGSWDVTLKAHIGKVCQIYKIDRWD